MTDVIMYYGIITIILAGWGWLITEIALYVRELARQRVLALKAKSDAERKAHYDAMFPATLTDAEIEAFNQLTDWR